MKGARSMLAILWLGISFLPIRAADPKIYVEDFEEPDGTPEDWVVYTPEGVIGDGWLVLRATPPTEPFAWAGREGVPISFDGIVSVSFTIDFLGAPGEPVGRHGGAFLCAKEPTSRAGRVSGYLVDWIDRAMDRGYRVHKYADGALTPLGLFPSPTGEPGSRWTIEFDDDGFTLTVDDEEIGRCDDFEPYRGGYVGVWCYQSAGQEVLFDDVEIVYFPAACPRISPSAAEGREGESARFTVTIPSQANATEAYIVTVTSSDPAIARPAGAQGSSIEIEFPAGGPQSQLVLIDCIAEGEAEISLRVEGADCASQADSTALLTVLPAAPRCFQDDFSDDDEGLPPYDWTVLSGMWTVAEERLEILATGAEAWIVAGNPAEPLAAVETIRLTIELSNAVDPEVGKHGGILFFAQDPLDRWNTRGYTVDWIDRAADQGYRFIRFDGNRAYVILGQTPPGLFDEPAYEWRIEADDEWIRFYGDDELIFEISDASYRGGHFALWAYSNSTRMVVDDVVVGDCEIPARDQPFIRGSTDGDVSLTIGDAIMTLNYLFASGTTPPCLKAADCDDSGDLTIGDPILFLTFLFAGGRPPAPPIPGCGLDPTPDGLSCESFPACPRR